MPSAQKGKAKGKKGKGKGKVRENENEVEIVLGPIKPVEVSEDVRQTHTDGPLTRR